MKLKIVRIEKDLPLPEYKTKGAVAFDFYSREAKIIAPGEDTLLPSNLIIEVPENHTLIITPRSSTSIKKGIEFRNIGVIDCDFHGPNDEIKLHVHNFTKVPVIIARGDRIAQGLIVPIIRAEWEEVAQIKDSSRGAFGSTG